MNIDLLKERTLSERVKSTASTQKSWTTKSKKTKRWEPELSLITLHSQTIFQNNNEYEEITKKNTKSNQKQAEYNDQVRFSFCLWDWFINLFL